jgi:transposase
MTRPSTSRYSTSRYPPELRERAVRLFLDHAADHPSQWAAIRSVGEKLGCRVDALWRWFSQSARDAGLRADSTTGEQRR